VQAAQLAVHVAQAAGEPGHAAAALQGGGRHLHGMGQGALEGDGAPLARLLGGEVEQGLLGRLDLVLAFQLRLGPEGAVHHRLAEVDQLAAQPAVVDQLAVLAGIDDADHGGEQLRQIGRAADLGQLAGVLELVAQGDGVGELAVLHPPADRGIHAAMDAVGEVLGLQELADAFIGLVVGEQRPQQRLFGLEVGRGQPAAEAEKAAVLREGGWGNAVHAASV
jgi:hypothetical protein